MQVHRAIADHAPARIADNRLAALGQQRTKHADAGPHGLDDVVIGPAAALVHYFNVQWSIKGRPVPGDLAAGFVAVDVAAQLADEFVHRVDVAEARHAFEGAFAFSHE